MYKKQAQGNETHAEMYQRNEEQLVRERLALQYDIIRSLAR